MRYSSFNPSYVFAEVQADNFSRIRKKIKSINSIVHKLYIEGHKLSSWIMELIIYMKKLLDSDWLRTVQFFLNTVQKRGN